MIQIKKIKAEIESPCSECEGDGQPGTCATISSLGRCPLEYCKNNGK